MCAWDSLKAHNGCLSLFDVKDLARGISGLSIDDVKPRNFQLRRVPSAPTQAGYGSSSVSQAPRMLLPPVLSCEAELDAVSQRVTAGCFLFVHSDSKVQVVRDRRTRQDLALAFPEVDEEIIDDVWKRTQLFCAASTVLTSLVNSGHHLKAAHAEVNIEDLDSWPSLMSDSEGWEQVPLPEGEEWVIVEDVATSLAQVQLEMDDESKMPAPRGLSYRDVLLTNVMDTEGAEWPEAPFRPSLGMRLEMLKKPKVKAPDEWDNEENTFIDEYYLDKAVAVRARKSIGRKRLTDTGKLRMAAKLASRAAAASGGGMAEDDDGDEMMA